MSSKAFYKKSDVFYYFLLHLSSSFMLSAAHNVLFFVLDIKLFVTQFLHFFFTFSFLHIIRFAGFIPPNQISTKDLMSSAVAKLIETILAGFANSHNRTGELFLVRSFDFLTTFSVVFYYSFYSKSRIICKPDNFILLPLALSVSISWFEPGQIEFSTISFISAALLPFARAASILTLKEAFENSEKAHLNSFILEYSRLISIFLFLPAVFSYFNSSVEVTASWESIDYILMYLSFLFMICNLYSELWLLLSLNINSFLSFDNSKYLIASCAQWIIQNMAHPSLIAFGAKLVAFSSLFRIWARS